MEKLKEKSRKALHDQGFADKEFVFEEYLNMRYRGTESALMIVKPNEDEAKEFDNDDWAFDKAFVKQHDQEFGFTLPDRDIIVDDVRVRGIGKTFEGLEKTVDQKLGKGTLPTPFDAFHDRDGRFEASAIGNGRSHGM